MVDRWLFAVTLATGLLVHCSNLPAADDETTKHSDAVAGAKGGVADHKTPKEADRFALPAGGVKELLSFLKETLAYRPPTPEAVLQFQLRGRPAVKAAAEKIMKLATDKDKQLDGFDEVEPLLLMFRAQASSREIVPTDQASLVADLKAYLSSHEPSSRYALSAALQAASGLEYTHRDLAAQAYREFGTIFARSKDEQIAKAGEKMIGAARRLMLLGQPFELTGTEMDGTKFDWSKYRGKVVLIDFWATWCGPCRAELPNVKRNYEQYHDQGFEVVGVSLDDDRTTLEKFLETEQLPWVTVYDGPDSTVANYYGISGLPIVMLVDKQGKVVSTLARGPELGRLLSELLGPIESAEATGPTAEKAVPAN